MVFDPTIKDRFLIRVVDDDQGVLTGLGFLLECLGWQHVLYNSAEEFILNDDNDVPGCILLDVRMPGMSGLALQQNLLEKGSKLPIIIITGHADVDTAVRTLKKGAQDFLMKPVNSEKLQEVLENSLNFWISQSSGLTKQELLSVYNALSEREKEILRLLGTGLNSPKIAERLNLSERTVQGHRLHILHKFRVHSKEELLSCLQIIEQSLRDE